MKAGESREDSYRLPLSISDPTAREAVEGSSIEMMSKDVVDWEHDKIMTFKEQQVSGATHDIRSDAFSVDTAAISNAMN